MAPEYSMLAWTLAIKKDGATLVRSASGAKYAKKIAELTKMGVGR
jgi:hypothetical protein